MNCRLIDAQMDSVETNSLEEHLQITILIAEIANDSIRSFYVIPVKNGKQLRCGVVLPKVSTKHTLR